MSRSREVRTCALQALYQFDAGMVDRPEVVRKALEGSPGDEGVHERGFDLATLAWEYRDEADAAVATLSLEWSTHRQPMIDRNLLRLAYYEMAYGETPPKVAINEAVELAKEFSTEKSHLFINGVLDKLYRRLREEGRLSDS